MAFFRDEPKITETFRTGKGVDWGNHDSNLYEGTEDSWMIVEPFANDKVEDNLNPI